MQCKVYNVYHTMYSIQCIVYNVYYTCNLSRPKEAASNLPTFKPFWKQFWKLEATFQPAGGRVIPKRGSEEQISVFRFQICPKIICRMIPEWGSEQLEIRNKNLKKEGDRRSSWFRFIPKLFVEQFNRHFNLREDINRKNAMFDT